MNVVIWARVSSREQREGYSIDAQLRADRLRAQREGWDGDWDEIQRRGLKGFMDNPTGRIGTVEEVGDLVAFLVSDRAGYINGSNLRIDGGSAGVVN